MQATCTSAATLAVAVPRSRQSRLPTAHLIGGLAHRHHQPRRAVAYSIASSREHGLTEAWYSCQERVQAPCTCAATLAVAVPPSHRSRSTAAYPISGLVHVPPAAASLDLIRPLPCRAQASQKLSARARSAYRRWARAQRRWQSPGRDLANRDCHSRIRSAGSYARHRPRRASTLYGRTPAEDGPHRGLLIVPGAHAGDMHERSHVSSHRAAVTTVEVANRASHRRARAYAPSAESSRRLPSRFLT